MDSEVEQVSVESFQLGTHLLTSRLIVGTGKYDSLPQMTESLDQSGSDCITVAVRRERLYDQNGQNLLDYIDLDRYVLLPNTAGCFSMEEAVRTAKLGREILRGLENDGASLIGMTLH